jgi:hypothetical protein
MKEEITTLQDNEIIFKAMVEEAQNKLEIRDQIFNEKIASLEKYLEESKAALKVEVEGISETLKVGTLLF